MGNIALTLGLAGVLAVGAYFWINTPVVQISQSTGDCMNVYSNNPNHSCGNLPNRYVQEWVK